MSAIDEVLPKLEKVTKTKTGWSARCPAHPDRSPSLSIGYDDGKVLLRCHRGCTTAGVVGAIGMTMADLFDQPADPAPRPRFVKAYPYHDADGVLQSEVVRFDPKGFRQRRPDGRGSYVWNLEGVDRVLYRLPTVIAAVAAGEVVYVAEGEKDADALAAAGVCATTSPQGADNWKLVAEHARQILKGACVVVVYDQDTAGIAYARDVARSLIDVATVVIAKPYGQFKDAAAHLGAGRAVTEFEEVAGDRFKDVPNLADWLNADEPATDDERPILTGLDIRALPDPFVLPPLTWHAKGLLVTDTHGEMGGPEKSLKSYVSQAIDVGLMTGLDVLGRWSVERQQRVLTLVGEGGERGFMRRLERICHGYGITIDEIRPWLRYTTTTAPVSAPRFIDSIQAELDTFQPDLVRLDPWYSYAPGDVDTRNVYENGAALERVGQLVRSGGATLMINNHFNQTGTGNGLRRISMAGHAEWCDSWHLIDHREQPDVDAGRFHLKLDVGSRQWGGGSFNVDFNIGRFDLELNDHIGKVTWQVSNAASTETKSTGDEKTAEARRLLVKAWKGRRDRQRAPWGKTDWIERAPGVGNDFRRAAFEELIDGGRIMCVDGDRGERGALYALAEDRF